MRIFHLPCLLFFLAFAAYGQEVEVSYTGQPLNEILLDINEQYGVELSIDARLSAGCAVKLQGRFADIDALVNALAGHCGLELLRIQGVYTFRAETTRTPGRLAAHQYLYQGSILERNTGEPLPFTSVMADGFTTLADEHGRFSFRAAEEQLTLRFSHLGYQIADTAIASGTALQVSLLPGPIALQEVVISSAPEIAQSESGAEAGHLSLNDVSTTLIPGNSNNMIFNQLRLYPGIMAAGESISDFIVWGSYPGQNQLLFDGITLFNSYGIKDDIGRVNPLMVKNIEVYKGGYNVHIGDAVGGVILVEGRKGNREEVDGEISISNEMANAYLSVPLSSSTTLQVAGRKSYFQWLNWSTILDQGAHEFITPTYNYGDGNLKLTARFRNNDQLILSAMASGDIYQETLERAANDRYFREFRVRSIQVGSSARYLHSWKKGGMSSVQFSQSHYDPDLVSEIRQRVEDGSDVFTGFSSKWTNPIREYSARMTHAFAARRKQDIRLGLAYIRDAYEFRSGNSENTFKDVSEHVDRLSFFVKDELRPATWLTLVLGLKADLPFSDFTPYFQPRVNAQFQLARRWHMSMGWGLYRQFISKTPMVDQKGNRTYIWQTADGVRHPVPKAMHHVLGLSYGSDPLDISIEGYYKMTSGLTRFFINRDENLGAFGRGNARAYGLDAYLKTRFHGHEFWVSYSLGKVEEKFGDNEFREAPHSQLHEVKTALVLNFRPVQLSVTHVYGSGFPNSTVRDAAVAYTPYSRLDLAFQYGVDIKSCRLETGFSMLNILNRKNIRLNQYASFPDGTTTSTSAIPFTPSVYVNFHY